MKKSNIFFLAVLLLILISALAVSLGYPQRVRFFPLFVVGLCLVLVIAELIQEVVGELQNKSKAADPAEEMPLEKDNQKLLKLLFAFIWIAALVGMIWVLGLVVALPLFTFAYIKMHGEGWRWALMLPAIMFIVVYVGFGILLRLPLYEGLLFI